MTVQRVSLKVTPDAALRVSAAREASFLPLVKDEPVVFLGNGREPEVLSPPVMPTPIFIFRSQRCMPYLANRLTMGLRHRTPQAFRLEDSPSQ